MSKKAKKLTKEEVATINNNLLNDEETKTMKTKTNTDLTIVVPEENTAEAWKQAAIDLGEQIGEHWTSKKIRVQIEAHWKELTAAKDKRTKEVTAYIRKDSVGRSWLSRKKLFGASGYKAGHSPWNRSKKVTKSVDFTTA